MYTQIFLKTKFLFNAAIADVPVYLLSITNFIFQQYIAIHNKCNSVPLTDAHLQSTCSEIVHVQHQSCNHTSIHARISTVLSVME